MSETRKPKVNKGCTCGALGCGGGILGVFAFVGVILYLTLFSNTCAKMMGEETYPIAGDPSQFNPLAAIPEIEKHVGPGAVLVDLDITSVRPDGTIDLKAPYKPAPSARYEFQRKLDKAPDGKVDPPIGAGRGPNDVWVETVTVQVYEPGVRRHVTRISGGSRSSYSYTNEGMDFDRSEPRMMHLGEPAVTTIKPSEMWNIAQKIGAPLNAVASVSYDSDGAQFRISGTKFDLRWDKSGKLDVRLLDEESRDKLGLSGN
jgi:hypothetical protein